jgi:hypothetical protein
MKVSKTAKLWIDYHKTNAKEKTVRSNRLVIQFDFNFP